MEFQTPGCVNSIFGELKVVKVKRVVALKKPKQLRRIINTIKESAVNKSTISAIGCASDWQSKDPGFDSRGELIMEG